MCEISNLEITNSGNANGISLHLQQIIETEGKERSLTVEEKQAVSEEMKFNTPDKLKQLLKANKLDYLYKDIEEINPNNAKQVAEGMKLVYDNWNCSPNGGVISDIVDYLNTQSQNQTVNETEQRWLKIAGIK